MEQLFTYETAKHTLVMTGYMMLIIFDCYWIGFLVISFFKWCFKKIKNIIAKFGKPKAAPIDASENEQ